MQVEDMKAIRVLDEVVRDYGGVDKSVVVFVEAMKRLCGRAKLELDAGPAVIVMWVAVPKKHVDRAGWLLNQLVPVSIKVDARAFTMWEALTHWDVTYHIHPTSWQPRPRAKLTRLQAFLKACREWS